MEDRVARGQIQFALTELNDHRQRIVNLEQQVANQATEFQKLRQTEPMTIHLKSQAAATQATEALYAPLRSDTKPLLEMSAFVRKVAAVPAAIMGGYEGYCELRALVDEAQEILKRST
jgi:hypothetical protein